MVYTDAIAEVKTPVYVASMSHGVPVTNRELLQINAMEVQQIAT